MDLGFTGTRNGMTPEQHAGVAQILHTLEPGRAHHGDCIGADAQFHYMCRNLGWWMVGHPPTNKSLVANCVFDEIYPALGYIQRNHMIVDSVKYMIAAPPTNHPLTTGGTWKTILYARKKSVRTWVVLPNGVVIRESWPDV